MCGVRVARTNSVRSRAIERNNARAALRESPNPRPRVKRRHRQRRVEPVRSVAACPACGCVPSPNGPGFMPTNSTRLRPARVHERVVDVRHRRREDQVAHARGEASGDVDQTHGRDPSMSRTISEWTYACYEPYDNAAREQLPNNLEHEIDRRPRSKPQIPKPSLPCHASQLLFPRLRPKRQPHVLR